jgi:hypothetical protein
MEITKLQHTYKSGPNKGKSFNQYKCSSDAAIIIVSELVDSNEIGLSYCSTAICDVENFEDGLLIANEILSAKTKDIVVMRLIAQKFL